MPMATVRIEGIGTFSVLSRTELRSPEWQDALTQARAEGRKIWCAGHNPAARLFPVTTPSGSLSLRRQALLHTPHCCLCSGLPRVTDGGEAIYAASVILPPRVRAGAGPAALVGPGGRAQHGTISHLLQKCFVEGWTAAFLKANQGRREAGLELMNPAFPEVLSQTQATLRTTPVGDSPNVFACARAHGRRAFFGWTDVDLATMAQQMAPDTAVAWEATEAWDDQGEPAPQRFILSHSCAVAGKFLAFGNIIPAPYLYFVSVGPGGRIERLWLGPLGGQPQTAVLVESMPERCFADLCAANGMAMQKPVQSGDEVMALGREFLASDGADRVAQGMPCRPDFVLWHSRNVFVVQVVGSAEPAYLAELAQARDKLTVALQGTGVYYQEVDCKRSSLETFVRQVMGEPTKQLRRIQLPTS